MTKYVSSFQNVFDQIPHIDIESDIVLEEGIDPYAYYYASFVSTKRKLRPDFFLTDASRKIYFRFMRQIEREFDEWNIERSMNFIRWYCDKNRIRYNDYFYHNNAAGNRTFLKHMKNFGISKFFIYKNSVRSIIENMETDTRYLYFGEVDPSKIIMSDEQKNIAHLIENRVLMR